MIQQADMIPTLEYDPLNINPTLTRTRALTLDPGPNPGKPPATRGHGPLDIDKGREGRSDEGG